MDQSLNAVAVACCALFLTVIGVRLAGGTRHRMCFQLLLAAVLLRLLACAVLFETGLISLVASDAVFYDEIGAYIALGWEQTGYDLSWLWRRQPYARYSYLVASLYYVVGWQTWLAVLLMALLGGLTVVGVYLIAVRYFGDQVAARAGWIAVFMPSLVLWTSLLLKEPPTLFALVVCAGCVLSLQERFRARSLIALVLALWMLDITRSYVAIVVAIVSSLALVATLRVRGGAEPLARVCLVGGLGLLLAARGYGFMGSGFEGFRGGVETLNQVRQGYSGSGSRTAYLRGVEYSTEEEAVQFLPLGVAYFLLSPFPWQIGSTVNTLIMVEMPFWYALLGFSIVGLAQMVRDRRHRPVGLVFVFFLVPLTLLYGLVSGNVGTAFRHRAQVLPLFAIAGALGYTLRERERRARRQARLQLVEDAWFPREAARE